MSHTRIGVAGLLVASCVGALIAGTPGRLCAADEGSDAETGPLSVQAVAIAEPPVIDGLLDDACWEEVSHIEDFWRERENEAPIEQTEAWLCYDSHAIYVAFRCHDSKPSEIRRAQKKRQGRIWDDDRLVVGIDVANTGSNWYSFQVTPAGTQYDGVPGGTSEKIEWKGDWRAAALVDESGWTAEIEIPFSILRYPDGQDAFRIYLSRVLARKGHDWCTWPRAFARVWDVENCARWTGISTPPVPFRCVFMPYSLSVTSEDEEDREPLTAGFNAKGTFPNGIVGLATYNPDFRNLEDVVETIDFTYVERHLEEYRPFFREGEWYFPGDIFYSRRIEDFDLGAKAFGTLGRHRLGLLDAYRRGGENHLAWQYGHRVSSNLSFSMGGADRRLPDEPHNQAYRVGGNWNRPFEGGNQDYYFNHAWTHTDGEGGEDSRVSVGAGTWRPQGFGWSANYYAIGPDFQADDGYVPETGVRNSSVGLSYNRNYDEGAVKHFDWSTRFSSGESEKGERRSAYVGHYREWQSGWDMWVGGSTGERDGFDQWDGYAGFGWNNDDMYRGGGLDFSVGERYAYPYRYMSISQAFHPSEKWSGQLRWERAYAADLDDDDNVVPAEVARQVVLTATYDITDERSVSARLVQSSGNTNAYAAYRQRVRKGMDLLVVVGDPNADEWVSRLAVKAIWCY